LGFVFKGRKGYDNIAPGSETGEENHIGLAETGGHNTSRSRGYAANATSQYLERIVTSDQGTTGQGSFFEQDVKLGGTSTSDSGWFGVQGGADVPGSTSNSSFWTSGTTFVTDVFPERVG